MNGRRFAHLPARAGLLLLGMAAAALGIALTAGSGLGNTPISTLPWVLSAITGLSFGTTTFLLNAVFVALEFAVLGRAFGIGNLLQLPAVFVFGVFIDAAMIPAGMLSPESWPARMAMSLMGNAVLAAGIVMQIRSKTIVQPGEGVVLAFSVRLRRAFGTVKIANDVILTCLSVITGLAVLGTVEGVREGTLVSAVLVGLFVKTISKRFPDPAGRPGEPAGK